MILLHTVEFKELQKFTLKRAITQKATFTEPITKTTAVIKKKTQKKKIKTKIDRTKSAEIVMDDTENQIKSGFLDLLIYIVLCFIFSNVIVTNEIVSHL